MGYKRDKSKELEEAKNDLTELDSLGLERFSKFALKAIESLPGYEFLIHDEKERLEKAKGKAGRTPDLNEQEKRKTNELFHKYLEEDPSLKHNEIDKKLIDYWKDKKSFELSERTVRRARGKK